MWGPLSGRILLFKPLGDSEWHSVTTSGRLVGAPARSVYILLADAHCWDLQMPSHLVQWAKPLLLKSRWICGQMLTLERVPKVRDRDFFVYFSVLSKSTNVRASVIIAANKLIPRKGHFRQAPYQLGYIPSQKCISRNMHSYYFMCADILPSHLSVHRLPVWCAQGSEENIRTPETRVIDNCEPPCGR